MSKSFTTEMPVVPRCPIFWASSNSNPAASVVKIIRFGHLYYITKMTLSPVKPLPKKPTVFIGFLVVLRLKLAYNRNKEKMYD